MTARVLTIAREDFRHVLRDRLVWGGFALVFLLTVPPFWQSLGNRAAATEQIGGLAYNFRLYAVILVAVVAVKSVVGERESGTVRLLLGLSGTRRDIVLGKLVSRVSILLAVLMPTFAILCVILVIRSGEPHIGTFVLTVLWMLLYGIVWTSFTVGVSAAFGSWYRTLAAFGVTYLVFSPALGFWQTLVLPLFAVPFTGSLGVGTVSSLGSGVAPVWYQYVGRLNPITAFVVGSTTHSTQLEPNLFGVVVLTLFGTVPLLVGYRYFERADLG